MVCLIDKLKTHLTQGLGVRGHVSQDDEDVLLVLVGQELGRGQGETRGDDPLDGRVVGQVQEEAHALHGAVLLEVLLEEASSLHVDAHGGEDDGEVVLVVVLHAALLGELDQAGLATDLGSDLGNRKPKTRMKVTMSSLSNQSNGML